MDSKANAPFAGKVAVVTGGSRGIGYAIAADLVRLGARVCVTARGSVALEEAVRSFADDAAIGVVGRADDPEHQDDAMERTMSAFGRIDMLVNNAGVNPVYGPLVELDLSAARKTLEVNAIAALSWTQKAHRAWMAEHGGSIVNVSSVSALRAAEGIGLYGASKAALLQLTRQLAVELGPSIRVNAVAPAVVETAFASALYEGRGAEVAQPYPLKRLGTPADVSNAVSFLLSPAASWITGQVIVLDGGITQVMP